MYRNASKEGVEIAIEKGHEDGEEYGGRGIISRLSGLIDLLSETRGRNTRMRRRRRAVTKTRG